MRRLGLMLVILALLLAGAGEASADYTLLVSRVNTRESAVPLAGSTLTGDVYIFVSPSTGVDQASFWLDDPAMTGTPRQTEAFVAWDFAGGNAETANAFDTRTVQNGSHTIAVALTLTTGNTVTVTEEFIVDNDALMTATDIAIAGTDFFVNNAITYPGTPAQGRLMNVRMVNSIFEDLSGLEPTFNLDANTDEFLAAMPSYVNAGIRAFTLNLQGGFPGYDGALNSAFRSDGTLSSTYLARAERVIRHADALGAVVVLGLFYFRQDHILRDDAAVSAGVVNAMNWLRSRGFRNVLVEICNEYGEAYERTILQSETGVASLVRLAKSTAPGFLVSASTWEPFRLGTEMASAADYLLIHNPGSKLEDLTRWIDALHSYGKPIMVNEDPSTGETGAAAATASVQHGASWGFFYWPNQLYPFVFKGTADDPVVYGAVESLTR